ncbi:MAG: hypothetical protein QM751_00610 [Paludibacteraceae bacterium]
MKETLPIDRRALLRADAWRSLAFIILSAGVIWLYVNEKLKKYAVMALLGFLIFLDLFLVARRYLNGNNFERKSKVENMIKPTPADEMVLQDKSQYRVLDVATTNGDVFNNATPSYFHHNVGEYHAAKLRRYQELINMRNRERTSTAIRCVFSSNDTGYAQRYARFARSTQHAEYEICNRQQ